MKKLLLAILSLFFSLLIALTIFAKLGFVDISVYVLDFLEKRQATQSYVETYKLGLQFQEGVINLDDQAVQRKQEVAEQVADLKTKEVDLFEQEKQLNAKAKELAQQEAALQKKEAELAQAEALLAEKSRLAEVYSRMEPDAAAKILLTLEAEEAADLLKRMPEKKIAGILPLMPPEQAASIMQTMQTMQTMAGR